MGTTTWENATLHFIPHLPLISHMQRFQSSVSCCRWQPQTSRSTLKHKWKKSFVKDSSCVFSIKVHATPGDSSDSSSGIIGDGVPFSSELEQAKADLYEAKSQEEAIGKERDQLLEKLAQSKAVQEEFAAMIKHDKELALAELKAAKSLFNQKLQELVEEKFALESKLVLAKQDAVELAVQVEKLAELAFQQATSHILEDALLRVSAAETSAAEAAHRIEEQIRKTTEGAISSIVDESRDVINKALFAAEQATSHTRKEVTALSGGVNFMDEIAAIQSKNFKLENAVSDLESQLLMRKIEVDKLKVELEKALAQGKASELRATSAEKAVANLQELTRERSLQREEDFKSLLEKIKKESADREKATAKAFKGKLEGIMSAVEAAKETAHLQDQAYMKTCAALQRSLKASEAATEVWKQRAETAESILHNQSSFEEEMNVVSGGRIDLLTDDDSQKWKLLAEGPRRELPEWMARRIRTICPKFPPRKINISKALSAETLSLNLPKPDEVWSIAQEKPKDSDALIERVIEKEVIEKKRKALERALHRKTIISQRTPEDIKLEPGTGTGREIVVSISLDIAP